MNLIKLSVFFALVLTAAVSTPDAAQAYIGPGAGLSAIGTAIAVVGAVGMLIVGFVWYPVKRLIKGRKAADPVLQRKSSDKGN